MPSQKPPQRRNGGMSDRAALVIIGVVTTVWAGNIIAGMFQINGYEPSEAINGIFLTIVGGAFVVRSRSKDGE